MGFFNRHYPIVLTVAVLMGIAGIYSALTPEIYESAGRVLIHREVVEVPPQANEATKNRWIWVRDGYALKDALVSQDFLSSFLGKHSILQAHYAEFAKAQKVPATESDRRSQFLTEFRKAIDVEWLGGDAFIYVIRVRDRSAALARDLTTALVERLKTLPAERAQQAYHDSLTALQAQINNSRSPKTKEELQETYRKIFVSSVLYSGSAPSRVEVIETPSVPLRSIWPRIDRLLVLAAIAGLAIGLLLEYILSWARQSRRTPAEA